MVGSIAFIAVERISTNEKNGRATLHGIIDSVAVKRFPISLSSILLFGIFDREDSDPSRIPVTIDAIFTPEEDGGSITQDQMSGELNFEESMRDYMAVPSNVLAIDKAGVMEYKISYGGRMLASYSFPIAEEDTFLTPS